MRRKALAFAVLTTGFLSAAIQLIPARIPPPPRFATPLTDKPSALTAAIFKAAPAARRAWPGYEPFEQPLLLAFIGKGTLLLGSRKAPLGFSRVAWSDEPIYFSTQPFMPRYEFVHDFRLDATTTTALRLHGPLDANRTMRLFFHERFHDAQRKSLFTSPAGEAYSVEDARDGALARLENRRLSDWLRRDDAEALRDFAAIRLRRRRLFPGTAAELQEERVEGTAKFVEFAALETAWSPSAVARQLSAELSARNDAYSLHKWRHYYIGAAFCRWLDHQKVPRWREKIQNGKAPSELVLRELALQPAEAARRADALTSGKDYRALEEEARRDLAQIKAERERWLAEYNALPGRRIVLTSSAAAASFTGDWRDFPDGSSLLVAQEWVVQRPEIGIRLMHDKCVLRRKNEAEFAVPPDAAILRNGERWAFRPGHTEFRMLSITAPPHVWLAAGPGALDDDGKKARLTLDRQP